MMRAGCIATAGVALLWASLAHPVSADGPAPEPTETESTVPSHLQRAQRLFEQGVALAQQADWRGAEARFLESNRIAERPNTLFNLALAQLELEDTVGAHHSLTRFLELADDDRAAPEDRAHAQQLLSGLEQRLARLQLTLEPAHAQLRVDGVVHAGEGSPRELLLRPGARELEAQADGYEPRRLDLRISAGASLERRLALSLARAVPVPRAQQPPSSVARPGATSSRAVHSPRAERDEASLWTSPWLWGGLGAAALGIAIGVIVATTHDGGSTGRYRGSAGVEL